MFCIKQLTSFHQPFSVMKNIMLFCIFIFAGLCHCTKNNHHTFENQPDWLVINSDGSKYAQFAEGVYDLSGIPDSLFSIPEMKRYGWNLRQLRMTVRHFFPFCFEEQNSVLWSSTPEYHRWLILQPDFTGHYNNTGEWVNTPNTSYLVDIFAGKIVDTIPGRPVAYGKYPVFFTKRDPDPTNLIPNVNFRRYVVEKDGDISWNYAQAFSQALFVTPGICLDRFRKKILFPNSRIDPLPVGFNSKWVAVIQWIRRPAEKDWVGALSGFVVFDPKDLSTVYLKGKPFQVDSLTKIPANPPENYFDRWKFRTKNGEWKDLSDIYPFRDCE